MSEVINLLLNVMKTNGRILGINYLMDYKKWVRIRMSLQKRKSFREVIVENIPNSFCRWLNPKILKDEELNKK